MFAGSASLRAGLLFVPAEASLLDCMSVFFRARAEKAAGQFRYTSLATELAALQYVAMGQKGTRSRSRPRLKQISPCAERQ
jgi:hypothetical protein